MLTRFQFENLDDVVRKHGPLSEYVPLGNGMWLTTQGSYRLYSPYNYITFNKQSWNNYKRKVHYKLKSLFHNERNGEGRQCHVRNVTRRSRRFRHYSSHYPKHNPSSRKAADGGDSYDQQEECSSVCMRETSNPRPTFSFRKAMDDLQSNTSTQTNLRQDPTYDFDVEKYGSVCSVEQDH